MSDFLYSPLFKYGAISILAGSSGYVLARPLSYAPVIALAAAVLTPLGTWYVSRLLLDWTPISGAPTMLKNLTIVADPPKTGVKIPESLKSVNTKFYQNKKTGRYYAQLETDQGSYKTSAWWVLA
jgi:hypothetical protein